MYGKKSSIEVISQLGVAVCLIGDKLSYRHFLAILLLHLPSDNCEMDRETMRQLLDSMCCNTDGQDIAEYAVMLAVILVIVIGVVRLIGSNANTVFSEVASGIQ